MLLERFENRPIARTLSVSEVPKRRCRMALSRRRMEEIALVILRQRLFKEGITLRKKSDFLREIGNLAKETSIPAEEILAFAKTMVKELFKECFR